MRNDMRHFWPVGLAAPALLVLVALLQMYRAQVYDLSPWKGGGFGMFTSMDRPSRRFTRCYLITEQGERPVEVPRRLADQEERARIMPTSRNLLSVARQIAQAPGPEKASRAAGAAGQPAVTGVRVEVWRFFLAPATRELRAERLREVTFRKES